MRLQQLVGKLALRTKPLSEHDYSYTAYPLLILSCTDTMAVACALENTDQYSAGEQVIIPAFYMDDCWQNCGDVINKASQTRAQIVRQMLAVIGLEADDESLAKLCKVLTYEDFLCNIIEELSIEDFMRVVSVDKGATSYSSSMEGTAWENMPQSVPQPSANMQPNSMSNTTSNATQSGGIHRQFGGFVRRG